MASTISYIINFNKTTGVYTLTSTKDELKVDVKHKKYEWLKSQDAGRIVKISDKGRWHSSKDYNGLYDEINSSSSKKKTSKVQTKTKSVDDKSSEVNELKTQFKELQTLKNKLSTENTKLKNENQLLKTENTSLKKGYQEQITSLIKNRDYWKQLYNNSKKLVPTKIKPKPVKQTEKKVVSGSWKVKIMATESYHTISPFSGKNKIKRELSINLYTSYLDKKPTNSYIKGILRKHIENKIPKYPIKSVSGLTETGLFLGHNYKLTNITILNIEEYK